MTSHLIRIALCFGFVAPSLCFNHPGVLVGGAALSGARERFTAGTEPTASFFQSALSSTFNYKPHGPPANGTISCGYYDNPNYGCTEEDADVDMAYTQALLFALGGNASLAASSRDIINLYSTGLHRYTNNTEGTCCGNEALQASWIGAKITRAAELLRWTPGSGWTSTDTANFNHFMYTVHLPHLINGTSANGNWMASFLEAMLGMAVFAEDEALFDHAVKAWRDRAPSYFYIPSDGAFPPLDPQPNCEPQPVCEWYNQTVWNASVAGVSCPSPAVSVSPRFSRPHLPPQTFTLSFPRSAKRLAGTWCTCKWDSLRFLTGHRRQLSRASIYSLNKLSDSSQRASLPRS
jgi:hypothetical protein